MSSTPDGNIVGIILGSRNCGKTDYVKGNPQHNLPGFFDAYLNIREMKVLVVLTLDHQSYRDIEWIPQDKLKYWKKGIYKILVNRRYIHDFCVYIESLHSMWNTFILFEDAGTHTKRVVSNGLNDVIINSKQKNIDVFFMYHTWMHIPADMYGMIDMIELFKTKSSPKKREDDMPGYYEEALETWNKVMAAPRFSHYMIETGNNG